ncbi:hypothetical protein ACFPRL_19915 [Pseudoclavibacter helvolus]
MRSPTASSSSTRAASSSRALLTRSSRTPSIRARRTSSARCSRASFRGRQPLPPLGPGTSGPTPSRP